jgi:hypothetical protein
MQESENTHINTINTNHASQLHQAPQAQKNYEVIAELGHGA